MVVVLAGYEAQIEDLLAVNPGLKSRFSERLLFPDFTAEDAVQLLKQQLGSKYSLELSPEAAVQLPGLMQQVGLCGGSARVYGQALHARAVC
jgi:stage V sporulation protein K